MCRLITRRIRRRWFGRQLSRRRAERGEILRVILHAVSLVRPIQGWAIIGHGERRTAYWHVLAADDPTVVGGTFSHYDTAVRWCEGHPRAAGEKT